MNCLVMRYNTGMSESSLPRSTPAEQGVDASGIEAFLSALDTLDGFEAHSFMALRNGHVVAERWWAPYAPEKPTHLYSLSKSLTSTALGFAVQELIVDLEAPVVSYFPELADEVADERTRTILVKHVASMASGHEDDTAERALKAGDGDLLRGLLKLPPEREPGEIFAYNQPCTYALGAIIQKLTAGTLTDFLRPRLFEPLGIDTYGWIRDGEGRELGYSGLFLTTEAVAKVGQLYLDNGVWNGEQVLPPGWAAEASRAHVATPGPQFDWALGYGYQFWLGRHGYRGDGAYGQFLLVLPEQDAVVVLTSQAASMQAVLELVWEHLLPALTAGSGPEGAYEPPASVLPGPQALGHQDTLLPATFTPAAGTGTEQITAVRVDGADLVLTDAGGDLALHLDLTGGWTGTGPVATSAAWSGGSLGVDVIFTETPHRLHLVLDPATATFTARWQTQPLSGFLLADLRMPRHA